MFVFLFGRGGCCCLAKGLPFLLRWCLFASVEVVLVERGVRYSRLYKSSSVGVLGGQDSGLEILLGEGGDVELGARTSKHIFIFAFDPLTLNSLSLSLSLFICVVHHSYHHILYACVVH